MEGRSQRKRLWEILQINLNDQVQAWEMSGDGTYERRKPNPALEPDDLARRGTHQILMDRTLERLRLTEGDPNA